MRVGVLAKGLLLRGRLDVDLVVLCHSKSILFKKLSFINTESVQLLYDYNIMKVAVLRIFLEVGCFGWLLKLVGHSTLELPRSLQQVFRMC